MPRNAEEKCHVETYRMLTFLNQEIFPDKRGASRHVKLRQTRNTFLFCFSYCQVKHRRREMKIKQCCLFFLLDNPFIFECIEVLECFRA